MKKYLLPCILLLTNIIAFTQTYQVKWGEEIKLKKGTQDLNIITADNTGLYFAEERLKMKSYFVVGASYGTAVKLYKMDKNFNEIFDKEYKKELKGLDFHSFQPLDNDLYLFATDYSKKEKTFSVYGAKIDKNSGDLPNDLAELGTYSLESKRDDYDMKLSPVQDGKSFLMVTNISGSDRVSLGVSLLDKNFQKKQNTQINLSFDPGHFSLQDVKYTRNDKIVVLGKEFEETQVGRKKRKRLVFKQYVMMIYNNTGRKEKDIPLASGDRFIISGKLIESPNGDLLLAGFYSNTSKKDELDGFFVNKLDLQEGVLAVSSFKEINSSMLGKSLEDAGDDDDNESKENKKLEQKAKDDDDDDDFPNSYIIRSVDVNPADNSIIITSEVSKYQSFTYSSSSYNSVSKTWEYRTTYVHRFINKDILIVNADKDGNIKWLNDLPKSQLEEIRSSSTSGPGISFYRDYGSYFASGGGMPYYSSYVSLLHNNNLVIVMNDHTSNNVNAQYGDKVKTVSNFKKRSSTYGVSIDLATGKMTRKIITANSDDSILMPRHSLVVNDEIYLPSWQMHLMAKTELKFARIIVK